MASNKDEMIKSWKKLIDAIRDFIDEPINEYAKGHCAPVEAMATELLTWVEHQAYEDMNNGENPLKAMQVCVTAALEVAFFAGYEMGKNNMSLDFCDCKDQREKAHLS